MRVNKLGANTQKRKAMTDCPVRRKQFFGVEEDADIIHRSDTSISDITSEVSFTATEGGYLSDDSDGVFTSNGGIDLPSIRRRRTKVELDSNRQSKIEVDSDTDDGLASRNFIRKTKNKEPKNTNNNYDNKNTNDGKLIYALHDDSQKRRSWTDSGVSLSRTDQSRCGTIGTDKSSSPSKLDSPRTTNIISDKMTRIRLFLADQNPDDIDGDSSLKETDAGDWTEKENFENKRTLSPRVVKRRNKFKELPDVNFNRFSTTTDRSSLTNVTVLSRNPSISSSMSSLSECTSVNYATSTTETTKQIETDDELEEDKDEFSHVESDKFSTIKTDTTIKDKETEIVDQLMRNAKLLEKGSVITDSRKDIDVNYFQSRHSFENRKKSRSFFSGLKKVLKPKFLSSKQYKDASSDFLYEKSEKAKNEAAFEELTAHVFGKLEKIQACEERTNHSISKAVSDSSLHKIQMSDELHDKDALQGLSSRPSKQNGFLKKLFRRSRSYSAERIVQKSKEKFRRFSSERSSVRSIPDHFGTTIRETENRFAKSLENIEYKHSSRSVNIDSFSQTNTDERETENLPRVRSLTSIPDGGLDLVTKPRARSTPNTPMNVRSTASSYGIYGLNSFENDCECDECRYADYLDFLAFQQFRRNGGFDNLKHVYIPSPNATIFNVPYLSPTWTPQAYPVSSTHETMCSKVQENVIAPLLVTVEKEREAKTLKTAMYDTFV